jgi:oxygen-dependent protoporphyrinogen oxidase
MREEWKEIHISRIPMSEGNLESIQNATRNPQVPTRVAIIGGGIAGLATAYYLQQKAHQAGLPLHYTLVESAPALGGKISTDLRDGFVIEGGPDSFITQKPAALQLCRELGLEDRLLGTNDARRKVYVLDGGRLRALPDGVMLVIPTRFTPFALSPLISIPGKLRMGMDLLIPARRESGDESLADFIRRRLGQEALDKIAEPLMAGIHVADPETLSLQATFPRFIQLEQKYGSLIKGMLAQKARGRSAPAHNGTGRKLSLFMTLRGGLRELVETLAARLEGELLTGVRVAGLERAEADPGAGDAHYHLRLADGSTLPADAVVLATPAYVSADLVEPLHARLAQELRGIRYVSTATVSLGFRRAEFEHPLEGFGFVVSAREKTRLMACTWTSTKFNEFAPDDHVLVRCFLGGHRHQELVDQPDESLVEVARDELRQVMGVQAEPVVTRVYRWPQANPQYDVGHLERADRLDALAAEMPSLYLTGSAYRGVGIPDCIEQGRKTAELLVEHAGRRMAADSMANIRSNTS